MTPAETALALLLESRDGEPARIWHDDGRTVTRLARAAGVTVTYVHCDLAALACDVRRVEGKEQGE